MSKPEQNGLNGAEATICMLQLHGVKYVFCLCGDTSLSFYDAPAMSVSDPDDLGAVLR